MDTDIHLGELWQARNMRMERTFMSFHLKSTMSKHLSFVMGQIKRENVPHILQRFHPPSSPKFSPLHNLESVLDGSTLYPDWMKSLTLFRAFPTNLTMQTGLRTVPDADPVAHMYFARHRVSADRNHSADAFVSTDAG